MREYTCTEVVDLVTDAGFGIERLECVDPWKGGITPLQAERITELIRLQGNSTVHRGQDIFLIARKPSTSSQP